MKIDPKGFFTEVHDASSMSELLNNSDNFGSPSLLIIYPAENFKADAEFPADAPFMTAFALSENCDAAPFSGLSDMIFNAGEIPDITEKLFNDRTASQVREITSCFITARQGGDVLANESRAFYRLMAEKNGGSSNE